MSELSDIAFATVAERAAWTTDPITHLRTGSIFSAEIDGTPDALTIASELGEDARNVILLHVNTNVDAYKILPNDLVTFRLFGEHITARIIKRRDAAANVQTDFWAQQMTSKDQT